MLVDKSQFTAADLGGGAPGPGPPIFACKNFLEPYIYSYANTCIKISSCMDLTCLLYVCVQVLKYNLPNTILNHTHPPHGRYASSPVWVPYSNILDPPLVHVYSTEC